ncbi:MAG: hypothetical protein R2764_23765 [Bacteroidales bacterium]
MSLTDNNKLTENGFFDYLLDKTKDAFRLSKTFEKYPENWNYAICDSPIQRKKLV